MFVVSVYFVIDSFRKLLDTPSYKTVTLPVVLYGCRTLSLTLREEHKLRLSETRALRRIFGSKGEELGGGCRELHYEEFCNVYYSPNITTMIKSRRMRWAEHVAHAGEVRNADKV
jgi:hypothetical protein